MKTKKLEKLESFQLKNKKLESILGGEGGPAKPSLDAGVQATGAGEFCTNGGQCLSYSSDVLYANGNYSYINVNAVDKQC